MAKLEVEDYIGKKFNRLVVKKRVANKGKHKAVLCECECGNETVVVLSYLKNGLIKSCGCLVKEINSKKCKERSIHNKSHTRLYIIWKNIRQRCRNPNASGYKTYGGRGITFSEEWNEYINFEQWALNNGYNENLTIDRIDNDGNYTPKNCRWVTRSFNTSERSKLSKPFKKSKFTEEEIKNAIEMRDKGATYSQIAKRFNCSVSHASRMVNNEIKNFKEGKGE